MFHADYNPITMEQALAAGDPFTAYVAGKTLAERAVWDLVKAHPHLDVTSRKFPCYSQSENQAKITPCSQRALLFWPIRARFLRPHAKLQCSLHI